MHIYQGGSKVTVKHWCEADYYTARDRARKAWECSQPQLVLGLEGADAGTTSLVASAPSSPSSPAAVSLTETAHPPRVGEGGLDNPTTRETTWA